MTTPNRPIADTIPEPLRASLRGRFLVFDGPDGSGKSTQHKRFVAATRAAGIPTVEVREPGGTEVGERIRHALLDHLDREEMSHIPHTRAAAEVLRIYKELAITGNKLAAWIRDRGWPAKSYGDSMSTDIMHIPLAIQAGLGELGKHGSLICKEHGSNVRISTVVTDLPMALDSPVDIAVDDLCATCRRCTLDCPPGAIGDQKQWVRGELRWYVDFDKCAPYFSITGGCAFCIEVCPWSEDGRGEQLSAQLLKKRAAKTKKPVPADAG